MKRLLIIGYGNPMRGDDGFGFRAAEQLDERLAGRQGLTVLAVHQLTPELAVEVADADRVIFIDAAAEGEPGKLECGKVEAAPSVEGAFTHFATPAGLLAAAQALYGATPHGELYTVRGERFDFGDEMSAGVREALDAVVEAVASTAP